MQEKLLSLLNEAEDLSSAQDRRTSAIALMRIILQHACISLVELLTITPSQQPIYLNLEDLRQPSDGTMVSMIAELMIAAENSGYNNISTECKLWREIDSTRHCFALSKNKKTSFLDILESFVALRNDGVEGHGLPGNYSPDAELDAVKLSIERFAPILPSISEDDTLILNIAGMSSPHTLKLLRTYNSDLVCYRKLKRLATGKSKVSVQIQRGLFQNEKASYEAEDVLAFFDSSLPALPVYTHYETMIDNWKPYVVIPNRLTEDFKGRDDEIEELTDWLNDVDSRACMLYGDGGIGKTTLAVEFIYRMLDGEIETEWMPELITFYTAKQTRWGLEGLERINARQVGVTDVALSIVRSFEETMALSRDWYTKEPKQLIQKLSNYLNEFGIDRKKHLIILDNTETLASSKEDVAELSKHIREITRRLGRVILTSRRRESIEARQIEITKFSDLEAVSFLKQRGKKLDRVSILQAGDPKLRKFANKLDNKPLLLEVFIQALAEPGIGLQSAFDRVMRMQKQDLGDFLYADAWNRINKKLQHLLLIMANVSDLHDDALLRLCCTSAEVSSIAAIEAINESRGIAQVVTIGDDIQISFTPSFLRFCSGKYINIKGQKLPTQQSIEYVKERYRQYLSTFSRHISDRVAKAYRNTYAKAALDAFRNGDIKACEHFYEDAVIVENDNGLLYDRYAYFLFTQRRYEEALNKSKKAVELLPEDPETWFTMGIIESRLGNTDNSILCLNNARKYGKQEHLCLIQQAYAYLADNFTSQTRAQARRCISAAESKLPNDQYLNKNLAEIKRLKVRAGLIES